MSSATPYCLKHPSARKFFDRSRNAWVCEDCRDEIVTINKAPATDKRFTCPLCKGEHTALEPCVDGVRRIVPKGPWPDKAPATDSEHALREYTSAERKAAPVHSGVMRYFPDALMAIARHSKKANDKHNPGEPLHWSRRKSADHEDCAARHLLTPERVDPETGEIELVGATWRSLAALQLAEEKRLVAAGIRPLSGIVE